MGHCAHDISRAKDYLHLPQSHTKAFPLKTLDIHMDCTNG